MAKDNGLTLFAYKVPLEEMDKITLPAIFESEGHLSFVTNRKQLVGLSLTGNVVFMSNQFDTYNKLSEKELTSSLLGSWVAVGVGGLSAISGGITAIGANKRKKKIASEVANMKEVPLENIATGLKVSTLGAKNRKEGQSVLEATQMASLAGSGTRGLLAGTGSIAAGSQAVNRDIAANLDEQQKEIDMLKAEDEGRIRGIKEQRNKDKLAALSSQYNAAADAEQQGYSQILQGVSQAGAAYAGKSASTASTRKEITPVSTLTPAGLSTSGASGKILPKFTGTIRVPVSNNKKG